MNQAAAVRHTVPTATSANRGAVIHIASPAKKKTRTVVHADILLQRISGIILVGISILLAILSMGEQQDGGVILFLLPIGLWLLFSKKCCMKFSEQTKKRVEQRLRHS